MMEDRPFSPACERNKQVILEQLYDILPAEKARTLLEIGSGTGQHAVFFAQHLQHITWLTADLPERHQGIMSWLSEFNFKNLKEPLSLDLNDLEFNPQVPIDLIYSANVLHIVSWPLCLNLFKLAARLLPSAGRLLLYGPYKYNGHFTSESNEQFDSQLRERDSKSGIRDFEQVSEELGSLGLLLDDDRKMPANNQLLVFKKSH